MGIAYALQLCLQLVIMTWCLCPHGSLSLDDCYCRNIICSLSVPVIPSSIDCWQTDQKHCATCAHNTLYAHLLENVLSMANTVLYDVDLLRAKESNILRYRCLQCTIHITNQ